MIVPLLVAATAAAMVVDWWTRLGEGRDGVETIAKPLATVGVIVLAAQGDPGAPTIWTIIALVLCLMGDVALLPRIDRFVTGLGAFLLGHLAFLVAFVAHGLDQLSLLGAALVAAGLLIATVGLAITRAATTRDPSLRRPVLAYLVVISVMAAFAWGTGAPIVILGATAFVVSDSILGWNSFVRPLRHGALLVMVTYHLAIGSLALSVW